MARRGAPRPQQTLLVAVFVMAFGGRSEAAADESVAKLDSGVAVVGIDRAKGGAITWLSWPGRPRNAVNVADPGRLIQQSYYAGQALDRRAEGQHPAWSPWTWNPIQGGGVASWARVTRFEHTPDQLYCETVPKLWDMPDEEAAAVMRQWTSFEPGMPDVIVVRCEFQSRRQGDDRWGPARPQQQELPACYFTRDCSAVKSYLGGGRWRDESQPPGPPWGTALPPRRAMACFGEDGEGIAVFSPAGRSRWNFGPHGDGVTSDPQAGPCLHLAPLATISLGPRSTLRYRYWIVVGSQGKVADRLDALWETYAAEELAVVAE